MGLVQAAARFNPTRRTDFKCFARRRIEGAILDTIRKELGWYSHHTDQAGDRGRDGDPAGAVDGDGSAIAARWNRRPMYQPRHDDPRSELLHEALGRLPEKQRRVIELHRLQGKELKEAAKEIGISPSWACKLDKAAPRALRTALGKDALLLLLPSAGVPQQARVPDRQERGRHGRRRPPNGFDPPIKKAAGIP
jgi:RNA polymerase sigma factor (sigma-70 family)